MGKYHARTHKAVKKADKRLLGVQLGALCLEASVPVQAIAKWVGVTRQGVYYWFTGVTDVAEKHQARVAEIMQTIESALAYGELPTASLEEALRVIKKYKRSVK